MPVPVPVLKAPSKTKASGGSLRRSGRGSWGGVALGSAVSGGAVSDRAALDGVASLDEHMVRALAETFLRFADSAETQQRELAKLAKLPATVVRIPLFETPLADVDGLGAVVQAIW